MRGSGEAWWQEVLEATEIPWDTLNQAGLRRREETPQLTQQASQGHWHPGQYDKAAPLQSDTLKIHMSI